MQVTWERPTTLRDWGRLLLHSPGILFYLVAVLAPVFLGKGLHRFSTFLFKYAGIEGRPENRFMAYIGWSFGMFAWVLGVVVVGVYAIFYFYLLLLVELHIVKATKEMN